MTCSNCNCRCRTCLEEKARQEQELDRLWEDSSLLTFQGRVLFCESVSGCTFHFKHLKRLRKQYYANHTEVTR